MTAQPVPDAALTAALGGYYGHPTAITAADPDVIDGLTAGLAAGLAVAADQIMARRCGQDAAFCAHCSCRSEDAAIIRGMSVPTGPPRDPHATGLINDDERDWGEA